MIQFASVRYPQLAAIDRNSPDIRTLISSPRRCLRSQYGQCTSFISRGYIGACPPVESPEAVSAHTGTVFQVTHFRLTQALKCMSMTFLIFYSSYNNGKTYIFATDMYVICEP